MIRVMVVEDEPPIAQSIRRLAEEWDKQVQVVHTAINGRRALEYLESNPVDVVFSDIKMPVMDGLELARHLHEDYPHIITVIISGFQEFEFARTAIRYGVSNYLLKPVSRENIAEVLEAACSQVRERRGQQARALLERAVGGEEAAADALETDERCGVALVCGGAYPLIPDEGMPESRALWSAAEMEEYLKMHAQPGSACICVHGRSLRERAVVFTAGDQDTVIRLCETMYGWLAGRGEIAVTVAVWEKPVQIAQVGEVLARLRKRIYKRIRLFRSQLIVGGSRGNGEALAAGEQQNALVLALRTGNLDAVRVAVAALVDFCVEKNARQAELVLSLEKTLMGYFDRSLDLEQMEELNYEIRSAVSTSLRPSELSEELSQVLFSWVRSDNGMEKDELKKLCEDVAAYLRLHYRENIRGADLARQFGMSSTLIAKKFKECYKLSISEYVNSFRIESAQAMMRTNQKVMIKEVALEVGYNDQYYFSKIFKKLTGVWPTEYLNPKAIQ